MTQFQLDTSGAVTLTGFDNGKPLVVEWRDLSPFTQGYIEAAFRFMHDYLGLRAGRYAPLAFSDLAPETLARIIADCEVWISGFVGRTRLAAPDRADMGCEFWRIRQAGRRSTFPPLTVQLGDDGKVRFAEAGR